MRAASLYGELQAAAAEVLALDVAVGQLELLDRGIGTKTPNAAWLRLRAALAAAPVTGDNKRDPS